jgi:hypothetical protein
MGIRDRITDFRRVPASELIPNPLNWRRHPESQQNALRGVLDDIGFADAVIARETADGLELIDGHLRTDVMGDDPVPVLVLDVTEEESKRLLATIDPLASMAEMDATALMGLLDQIESTNSDVGILLDTLGQDAAAQLAADSHMDKDSGGFWTPPDPSLATGEHADEYVGYDLGSVWYQTDQDKNTRLWPFKLELPANPLKQSSGRLYGNYSRSPLQEMESIVRTYMREGDRFLEVCAGWWTFSATAAMWGYSGDGCDIWDVSLGFGRRQMAALPAQAATVNIHQGDARNLPFDNDSFDFVYCNPPFFQLERYSDLEGDLAASGTVDEWLTKSGDMMAEMARVARSGSLIVTVMADYRDDGKMVPLSMRWIAEGMRRGLILHDIVIARLLSQQVRMWRKAYEQKRTAKTHEYVITFRKP